MREQKKLRDLQDGDEQRIPEILGHDEVVAIAVEFASLGVVAVRNADEDPHEDDGSPASEAVVQLKEAIEVQLALGLYRTRERGHTCGGGHGSKG